MKKKNPQDLTLRNLRALKKLVQQLAVQVLDLSARVVELERTR